MLNKLQLMLRRKVAAMMQLISDMSMSIYSSASIAENPMLQAVFLSAC